MFKIMKSPGLGNCAMDSLENKPSLKNWSNCFYFPTFSSSSSLSIRLRYVFLSLQSKNYKFLKFLLRLQNWEVIWISTWNNWRRRVSSFRSFKTQQIRGTSYRLYVKMPATHEVWAFATIGKLSKRIQNERQHDNLWTHSLSLTSLGNFNSSSSSFQCNKRNRIWVENI